MPAKAAMSANYYANIPDQFRQKFTYGNMAESELVCVRVAALLRNKNASKLCMS